MSLDDGKSKDSFDCDMSLFLIYLSTSVLRIAVTIISIVTK